MFVKGAPVNHIPIFFRVTLPAHQNHMNYNNGNEVNLNHKREAGGPFPPVFIYYITSIYISKKESRLRLWNVAVQST